MVINECWFQKNETHIRQQRRLVCGCLQALLQTQCTWHWVCIYRWFQGLSGFGLGHPWISPDYKLWWASRACAWLPACPCKLGLRLALGFSHFQPRLSACLKQRVFTLAAGTALAVRAVFLMAGLQTLKSKPYATGCKSLTMACRSPIPLVENVFLEDFFGLPRVCATFIQINLG